ncbi:MAG: hypothetical protein ABSA52_04055 [Candidatus Binatia bacterium]
MSASCAELHCGLPDRCDPNADPDVLVVGHVSAGREHGMREREPALSQAVHSG